MKRSNPSHQWAYVYEITPPDTDLTLGEISELLSQENSRARRRRINWVAKLVIEEQQARILIVCDSPSLNRKVNHRLEEGLRRLRTEFTVTVPMAIEDDITPLFRTRRAPT